MHRKMGESRAAYLPTMPPPLHQGWVELPETPDFGIEVDAAFVERMAWRARAGRASKARIGTHAASVAVIMRWLHASITCS